MELISHRGNISGPSPAFENMPEYVQEARKHFKVEVDVWKFDGEFWLGHDAPVHRVDKDFLLDGKLLLHCKNLEALAELSAYAFAETFFQESDLVTLTSRGRKLFHARAQLPKDLGSGAILVDLGGDLGLISLKPDGLITDYPDSLAPVSSPHLPFDLLILDIDGVLTPGVKVYGADGSVLAKTFGDKDFTAIKRFKRHGVSVCFLSGDSNVNEPMARDRGIDFFNAKEESGKIDKSGFLQGLKEKYQANRVAYVGDDYYDLTLLAQVDLSYCPSDAIKEVREICSAVIPRPGGSGVIEKLYEMTMSDVPQFFTPDNYRL